MQLPNKKGELGRKSQAEFILSAKLGLREIMKLSQKKKKKKDLIEEEVKHLRNLSGHFGIHGTL